MATGMVADLKEIASKTSSDDIKLDAVYDILAKGSGALYTPTPDEAKHAERWAKKVTEPDEKVVKSWVVVFHNSAGKEQQRVLMATDKALYRIRYNFKKGAVESSERCGWDNLQLMEYGQFQYATSLFPSIGQLALKSELNKLYGFRMHYKEKPKSVLPIPFLVEKYIDNCFKTFRPVVDPKATPEVNDPILQNVTQEIVFTCIALLRKSGKLTEGVHYVPMSNPSSISICATRGLIAAVHNKMNMGSEKIEAPTEEKAAEP